MRKFSLPTFCIGAFFLLLCIPCFSFAQNRASGSSTRVPVEVKLALDNIQSELSMLRESVRIQQDNLSSISSEFEQFKNQNASLSNQKVTAIESNSQSLRRDIQKLSDHANDSTKTLESYRKKILSLENVIDKQNQNISNLQSALTSVMDAVGGTSSVATIPSNGKGSYKVQSGDCLDTIAKKFDTNVKDLKLANNLEKDLIFIGQKLLVPN